MSKNTPSRLLLHKSCRQSGDSHKQSGSGKIVGSFFYMLSGNKYKLSAESTGRMCMGKQKLHNIFFHLGRLRIFSRLGQQKIYRQGGEVIVALFFAQNKLPGSTREL
jgi:hypothetical protein